MNLKTVKIEKPDDTNFILGQTHFIKSAEDIHEALVAAVPGIKFGLAFCEASGKCLVRWSGTDPAMIELAKKNAAAVGAGHSFFVFLGDGFYHPAPAAGQRLQYLPGHRADGDRPAIA
jgi:adenosine/AMP kinase